MRPPRLSLTPLQHSRALHSTVPLLTRPLKNREPIPHPIPSYPHGARQWYKQANRGLYGTLSLRTGHTVSEKNEIKTPRTWRPNVHTKRLWSEALGRFVRVRVVARVIRTIDKVGGLDNYLLGDGKGRIRELGVAGWALRWRLWRTEKVRTRLEGVRRELGLTGRAPWEVADEMLAGLGGRVVVKGEKGEGMGVVEVKGGRESVEEKAREMESKIDEELDRDAEAVELSEEGGVQLHDEGLFEQEERPGKRNSKS